MEAVIGVQEARPAGGGAGDLHRRLDRLRTRVRRHHRGDAARSAGEQLLGQDTAQERHPELRQVGGSRGQQLVDGRDHVRVIASEREHAVARDQVEVALAVGVDQVRAVAADPGPIEP